MQTSQHIPRRLRVTLDRLALNIMRMETRRLYRSLSPAANLTEICTIEFT